MEISENSESVHHPGSFTNNTNCQKIPYSQPSNFSSVNYSNDENNTLQILDASERAKKERHCVSMRKYRQKEKERVVATRDPNLNITEISHNCESIHHSIILACNNNTNFLELSYDQPSNFSNVNYLDNEHYCLQIRNMDQLSLRVYNLNPRSQKILPEVLPNILDPEINTNVNLSNLESFLNTDVASVDQSETHHIDALFVFDNPYLQEQENGEIVCLSSDTIGNNDVEPIIENLILIENSHLQRLQPEQTHRVVPIVQQKIARQTRETRNTRVRERRQIIRNRAATYQELDINEHYLGEMDTKCIHCGALHFEKEKVANKGNSFNDCCSHGDAMLQKLPDIP